MSIEMKPIGETSAGTPAVVAREEPPKQRSCITNFFCRHWSQMPILILGGGGSAVAGGAAVIYGTGIAGPIGGAAGGIACLISLISMHIIGRLKPEKDLEELVGKDLKEETEQLDVQTLRLEADLRELIEQRQRLEYLLQQEQQLTREQAEQLAEFRKLGDEIHSTATSFGKDVKAAQSEIGRLKDQVDGQDRENDETKAHVKKLAEGVSGYDRENAENLEQLKKYESLNAHAIEMVDEVKEAEETTQKLLTDIAQVTELIDREAEKLQTTLDHAGDYLVKKKKKRIPNPAAASSSNS